MSEIEKSKVQAIEKSPMIGVSLELVEEYLRELKPTTQKTYRGALSRLAGFCSTSLAGLLRTLQSLDVSGANLLALRWKNDLAGAGYLPASVNLHLSALKSLCRFLRMIGAISWTIETRSVKAATYKDTRGISLDQYKSLVASLSQEKIAKQFGRSWQVEQAKTILQLMLSTALRRQEIAALSLGDIESDKCAIWVQTKGASEKRRISLTQKTKAAIIAWLGLRESLGVEHDGLFVRGDGERLTGNALYYLIQRIGKIAGNGLDLRPHQLRHTAITQAFEAAKKDPKIGIAEIQKFSGHAKIETLLIYRDQVKDDALAVSSALDELLIEKK